MAVLVALVAMLISGCSADEEEFPHGAWAVETADELQVIDFRADGSLWGGVGTPGQDPRTVALEDLAGSASYSVSGDILTFTGACPEPEEMVEATYRWGLDGDEVTLDIISDPCAYRGRAPLRATVLPAPNSRGTGHDPLDLPMEGEAAYFNVVVDGRTNRNAAFTYANPTEAAASIAGYVAFWHGVKVGADGTGSRTLMDRLMGRAQ